MRFAPLLAAVIALPLFAAGPGEAPAPTPTQEAEAPATWPQKGDTVYLSAKLAGRSSAIAMAVKIPDLLPMDSCVAVRLIKRNADSDFFRIKDESGDRMLEGPWLSRMHRTVVECAEVFTAKGQPHLEAKGYRYLLIEEPPH